MCRAVISAARPEYEKIEHPLLLITGDEDKSSPPATTAEILDSLGSRVKHMVVLKGVGHQQCIEDSDGVARAIVSFMALTG